MATYTMRADGAAANLAAALDGDPSVASECLSIAGHNSYAAGASAGDTFQFTSQGGIFHGTELQTKRAGSDGSPILYKNYGSETPEICAAVLLDSGWTGGPVWQVARSYEPNMVFYDGTLGTKQASSGACDSEGDWYWASNVLYLYCAAGNPATVYTSPGVEASDPTYAMYVGHQYITVEGLKFSKGYESNIRVVVPNFTMHDCISEWAWYHGLQFYSTGTAVTNAVVYDSEFRFNGNSGLSTAENVSSAHFYRNYIHDNAVGHVTATYNKGIQIYPDGYQVSSIIVEQNLVVDNGEWASNRAATGIWCDDSSNVNSPAHSVIIRNNWVQNCTGAGIWAEISRGVDIYGNIVIDCATRDTSGGEAAPGSIRVDPREDIDAVDITVSNNTIIGGYYGLMCLSYAGGTAQFSNNVFRNNIAVDSEHGNLFTLLGAANDGTHGSGNVYDHNCFGAEANDFIYWAGTYYDTYDAFIAASSQADNNIEADPSFTDPDNDDYTLASDSPCIGAGADMGEDYDDCLLPGSTWPDGVLVDDPGNY